jgi:hypothetical protein
MQELLNRGFLNAELLNEKLLNACCCCMRS